MTLYDYRGAIHCHSTYSDGTGTMEEVMQAANEVGLDYVVMTDHETNKPFEDGHARWQGSVLLIPGVEITPRNNHYIVCGKGKLEGAEELHKRAPQEYIDAVREQGWIGFLAHPHHVGTQKYDIPSYRWEDWSVDRFTGMSIWDLMTDWQSKLDAEKQTLDVYDNFAKHLSGPKAESLKAWDELNQRRKVVGIGEIDNHRKRYTVGDRVLEIFPYDVAFRTITNHILLEKSLSKDYETARDQVLNAVGQGRVYVSFDYWADPTEFRFLIEEDDREANLGDTLELEERALVLVQSPETVHLCLICNGQVVQEAEGDELMVEIEKPGVYRVEAIRDSLIWVVTNPIYVTQKK